MSTYKSSSDEALIMSRVQKKELLQIKPGLIRLGQALPPMSTISLDPFIDQLPIKIGLELNTIGSRIMNCRIDRGYLYNNLEHLLSKLTFPDAQMAITRLNQATPIFGQLALNYAMESLFGIKADDDVEELRCFLMEYSRIFHHWRVLHNMLTCLEQDTLADNAITAISLMQASHDLLCRIYRESSRPKAQVSLDDLRAVLEELDLLAKEVENGISFDLSIRQALRKKAVATLNVASSFGLTGAYLRANRNQYDLRAQSSLRPYESLPTPELSEGGDAWARLSIRIREIIASINWVKKLPLFEQPQDALIVPLIEERIFDLNERQEALSFGEVDAPEGDLKISAFFDPATTKLCFRIRTPAYFIAQALPHLLAQIDLYELPLILFSLGINAEEIDK